MPWQAPRKIHIYVPLKESPYDRQNWDEQVLGNIVGPLFREFEHSITWLFTGRYERADAPVPERYYEVREDHDHNKVRVGQLVALRLSAKEDAKQEVEARALELIHSEECFPEGWKELDLEKEFEPERYCSPGTKSGSEKHQERIRLIVNSLDATTKLRLTSLIPDSDGIWGLEPNKDTDQNPQGSFFQSVHHLFCNTTSVPTRVWVAIRGNQVHLTTNYMLPDLAMIDLSSIDAVKGFPEEYLFQVVPLVY